MRNAKCRRKGTSRPPPTDITRLFSEAGTPLELAFNRPTPTRACAKQVTRPDFLSMIRGPNSYVYIVLPRPAVNPEKRYCPTSAIAESRWLKPYPRDSPAPFKLSPPEPAGFARMKVYVPAISIFRDRPGIPCEFAVPTHVKIRAAKAAK